MCALCKAKHNVCVCDHKNVPYCHSVMYVSLIQQEWDLISDMSGDISQGDSPPTYYTTLH